MMKIIIMMKILIIKIINFNLLYKLNYINICYKKLIKLNSKVKIKYIKHIYKIKI